MKMSDLLRSGLSRCPSRSVSEGKRGEVEGKVGQHSMILQRCLRVTVQSSVRLCCRLMPVHESLKGI